MEHNLEKLLKNRKVIDKVAYLEKCYGREYINEVTKHWCDDFLYALSERVSKSHMKVKECSLDTKHRYHHKLLNYLSTQILELYRLTKELEEDNIFKDGN